jgi:S1-C subfamily serine protease
VRTGDLIVSVNQQAIRNASHLSTQLALLRVGDLVNVEVIRDGRPQRLQARIADPYEDFVDGRSISRRFSGTRFGEVVDESGLGTNPGIAVGPVKEDSNAWNSGLREGDVLFQVNRVRVKTLQELRAAAEDGIHQIRLRRGDRLVTLVSR